MFQILNFKGTVNFLRHAVPISILSMVLIAGSIVSLVTNGINWGLDFYWWYGC